MTARDNDSAAGGTPRLRDVTVREVLSDRRLAVPVELVSGGGGLDRPVHHPRIQKSGLALAGHFRGVVPTRVQVLGETELSYLETLREDRRGEACRAFFGLGLSVVVITRGVSPDEQLVRAAEASGTALYVVDAATMPDVQGGQYYGPDGLGEWRGDPKLTQSNQKSYDEAVQDRLWTVSEELTGVTFPV